MSRPGYIATRNINLHFWQFYLPSVCLVCLSAPIVCLLNPLTLLSRDRLEKNTNSNWEAGVNYIQRWRCTGGDKTTTTTMKKSLMKATHLSVPPAASWTRWTRPQQEHCHVPFQRISLAAFKLLKNMDINQIKCGTNAVQKFTSLFQGIVKLDTHKIRRINCRS